MSLNTMAPLFILMMWVVHGVAAPNPAEAAEARSAPAFGGLGEDEQGWVRARGPVIRTQVIRAEPTDYGEVCLIDSGREVTVAIPDLDQLPVKLGQEVEAYGVAVSPLDDISSTPAFRLLLSGRGQLRVIREPEEVARELPLTPLASLVATSITQRQHLIRVTGGIHSSGTNDLLLSDGANGLRVVNCTGQAPVNRHQLVAMGFLHSDGRRPWLELIWFRDLGLEVASKPLSMNASLLIAAARYGQWVETEAEFLHRSSRTNGEVLVLGDAGRTFEALLPTGIGFDTHQLKTGTRLRVRGVVTQVPLESDADEGPQLLVEAGEDLRVVASPPWPTSHTVQVILVLLVFLMVGLIALAVAHRRLKDSNRRAQLVDDQLRRLNTELEFRIQRRTSELESANVRLTMEVLERREAEMALAEEGSKRRTLLNSSRDGIVVLTEHAQVHEVNESFASMLGYTPEEIRHLKAWDWETEWTRNQALSVLRAVGSEGSRYETIHRRKSGDLIEVEVTSNAAWWRGQKYIVCVCRDLRERRQAEVMRRDQAKVLEMIAQGAELSGTLECLVKAVEAQFEGMFGSILLVDEEGLLMHHEAGRTLPEAYRSRLGKVAVGEGIGSCGTAAFRKESFYVHDIAEHPFWSSYRDMALGSGLKSCWSVPILDESREILGTFAVYGTTVGSPRSDQIQLLDMAVHTAAVCIRCARAKEALHRSEKRFQYAMQGANDGLWDWDLTTNRAYFSPRWKSMLGYADSELPHHLDTWKQLVHPQDLEPTLKIAGDVVSGKRDKYEAEFRMRHKQGSWINVLSRGFLVRHADGTPERLVGTHADVTQRKEAERCRAQLEIQLRQAQKMEAIGTLAGGIAHDFNNILGAIIAHAELIRLESQLSASTSESLTDLLKASHRAKELVKQILTFSRQQEPQRRVMEFEPVLRESLSLLRAALPARVELRVRVNDPVPSVMGDATLIQQVIMNLATNAAQAIGDRVGRLDIELGPCFVDAKMAAAHQGLKVGSHVRLRVKDNGPGIAPEVLERIFEPFFTTKAPGQGTGLGLSVVHGIVHEHEGVILVDSQLDSGSCFDVLLPVAAGAIAEPTEKEQCPAELHGEEHVLLIDDEPSLLRVGERILRHRGFRVTTCSGPQEAFELFSRAPDLYDLVVTDYSMPTESGLDLAVRLLALRPGMPILICTGYGAGISKEQLLKLGIRGILQKPIALDELCRAVRQTLDAEEEALREAPELKAS
ncbi:MAG: PAS domain S-box protein [Verrucomicrobiales bacterium]|nr:PAS domain S-box protein [Verrucomicrobiales bacterium]